MVRSMVRVLVVVLALAALVGVVSADGGINGAPNGYFGGDSFFCSSARGCWLLNGNSTAKGSVPALLGEFAQADIQAALTTCKADATNVQIGTIQGTYGPFTLSAVYDGPNADPVCSLQINAFEAAGKEAKPYVFSPKSNGGYNAIANPSNTDSCHWDLAAGNLIYEGHIDGFEIWQWDYNTKSVQHYWSSSNQNLPSCDA